MSTTMMMMMMMMLSGYSEKFRLDTIQAAVKGYERQCQEADS